MSQNKLTKLQCIAHPNNAIVFNCSQHSADSFLSVFAIGNELSNHGVIINWNVHSLLKSIIYTHSRTFRLFVLN
jgi:hypothetical protein